MMTVKYFRNLFFILLKRANMNLFELNAKEDKFSKIWIFCKRILSVQLFSEIWIEHLAWIEILSSLRQDDW